MYVVTLFELADGQSVDDYRAWTAERVRPVMRAMPSVVTFEDFRVVGHMDGEKLPYSLVEIIEVTDADEFERDNATGEGAVLAEEWRSRLSRWSVMYLEDLVVTTS